MRVGSALLGPTCPRLVGGTAVTVLLHALRVTHEASAWVAKLTRAYEGAFKWGTGQMKCKAELYESSERKPGWWLLAEQEIISSRSITKTISLKAGSSFAEEE